MFYDSQVMNSKNLKNAWRAGNNQELCSEDVHLPKVCTRLDSWIASDYVDPCRRLALRASSILIDGAAKLYKQGLADLVQDMYELEYQMITRKRPRDCSTEDSDDSGTSEFEQPNEAAPPGHSASPVTPDSSDGQIGKSGKKSSLSINSGTSEFEQPNEAAPPGHSASPVTLDSSDGQSGKKRNSFRGRHNQSKKRNSTRNEGSSRASNEELPTGQVFIYEGLRSLVPRKIIIGTLNPAVKKNIKS